MQHGRPFAIQQSCLTTPCAPSSKGSASNTSLHNVVNVIFQSWKDNNSICRLWCYTLTRQNKHCSPWILCCQCSGVFCGTAQSTDQLTVFTSTHTGTALLSDFQADKPGHYQAEGIVSIQ